MRLPEKAPGASLAGIKRADEPDPGPSSRGGAPSGPSSAAAPAPPRFDNSPLPPAMLAVAHHDSPENRRVLYESMFQTWFLVPTRETPVAEAPGFHDIHEGVAASFSLEHDSQGQLVAVTFTDEEALRNWNKSIPWIALQGTSFFQAVLSTQAEEIVINPFEPEDPGSNMIRPGGRVTRREFESLAQGIVPQAQPGGQDAAAQPARPQSVLVAMPKQMPSAAMFNALALAARAFPEVVAMYFAQVSDPQGETHWTVAVEFVPGVSDQQIRPAMAALVKAARRVFPRRESANFLLVSTPLGQSVASTGKKFYGATR